MSWWQDAVIYQVYPRSFQDSDGDGNGDLAGIERRLDHLKWLGADAVWLSPIYPSPMADMGYDVADFTGVDPAYGTLQDFDALLEAAHERGLKLLLDLVPCHTSIDHPWFVEHPDWYIWSDRDGPQNNWVAAFGGEAWAPDPHGRGWYLHSFYPEQADLDWRNPEVVEAMQGVIRFWLDRGVDGFRLDAIDHLMKDRDLRDNPPATEAFGLPVHEAFAPFDPVHSINSPDIGEPLAAIREAAGDALLVGEVYLPAAKVTPYLDHLDVAFAFELFHSAWEKEPLAAAISAAAAHERGGAPAAAWVLSNHDFPRLATRFGEENARAAALLLLTLPGTAFVYQGEEIGMSDGPGADPPIDRAGRDGARHPMQWEPGASGGFSDGRPWLPVVDPAELNVADEREDPESLLSLYRRLIALRPTLGHGFELLPSDEGVLAYRCGGQLVAINLTSEPRPAPPHGSIVLSTDAGAVQGTTLAPHEGRITHPRD
jgi:alpha-glucosidase